MMHTIRALTEIRDCCGQRRSIPPELQPWLSDAIGKFLDKSCEDLDEAFGLKKERGGVPWWLEFGIAERDDALRQLAREHLSSYGISAQARMICEMAHRYETSAWPRDARKAAMPEHYAGTSRQYLWRAFRSGARMPVSARHLRNVLQGVAPVRDSDVALDERAA